MATKAEPKFDPTPRTERERVLYEAARLFHNNAWDWKMIALTSAALNVWLVLLK